MKEDAKPVDFATQAFRLAMVLLSATAAGASTMALYSIKSYMREEATVVVKEHLEPYRALPAEVSRIRMLADQRTDTLAKQTEWNTKIEGMLNRQLVMLEQHTTQFSYMQQQVDRLRERGGRED